MAVGQIEGAAATSASNVTFTMRRSNSGLMGLTSPVDANVSALVLNRDIERDVVTVAVNVTGAGNTTHTLDVTLSGGSLTSGTLVFTPTSGMGCSDSIAPYSCTVPNSVGVNLTFTGATATHTCSGASSYTTGITDQSITITMPITCAPTSTTHTLLVTLSGGTTVTGTLTVTPAIGTGNCTGSDASYSCTVPNSETGRLSFTGLTSAGASCSGTVSYTSSAQSTSMTITCQAMRSLTTCVTSGAGTKVESGTAIPSTAGSCGTAGTCGSGNKGLQFSCSVPNG